MYDDTKYDDTKYDDTKYDDTKYDDTKYDDTKYDDTKCYNVTSLELHRRNPHMSSYPLSQPSLYSLVPS